MTITSSSEQTGVTPETSDTPKSIRDALERARAYERLAAFLTANPDLAKKATVHPTNYTLIFTPRDADAKEFITGAARRGREFGAEVEEYIGEKHGGVKILFGPLYVEVYAPAEQVVREVVVGTIPDVRRALAFDLDGNPREAAEQDGQVA